ncbi:MAG TPA: hypothetical protein VFK85_15860 [Anaeromyxobacteraceae bacterium]|nr:hypothetical protein [Anaeromyxobacteraceae bacterium]
MRHLLTFLTALMLATPALAADPGADAANGYAIDTAGSTQKLSPGAQGKLVFTIHPRGEWHVDPRTPLRIDLTAPEGLKLAKERLGKKDAATPNAEAPRFEAPFTAVSAGTHVAKAKLDFFVCSATACVKQVREVSVPVTVQ